MLSLLIPLLWLVSGESPERMPAPDAGCLDARAVTQMRQLSDRTLIIATDVQRYRLELAAECPDLADGASLLATQGWVCGLPREFVQSNGRLCAVIRVDEINTRDYAQAARALDQSQGRLLAAVEAKGRRTAQRGFRGSPDYCFRPSLVRAWAADADGILVQTNKRRSGGFGAYRVEFGSTCPEIAYLSNLTLRSGVGLDLICGNAGDAAELSGAGSGRPMIASDEAQGLTGSIYSRRGCAISAVYPVYERQPPSRLPSE